jgi:hypothetical protein
MIAIQRRLLLMLGILAGAGHAIAQGTFPMTVTTTAPLPPPLTWTDLQEQAAGATVTIANSGPARQAAAFITLRCAERGIVIRSRNATSPDQCIDIDNGTQTFSLDEVSQQVDGAFSQDDFEFTGITYAQVRDQQLLPEGYWEICIQLLDCADGSALSAPIPAGCAGWVVVHPQPPILTNICGTNFMLPDGVLQVAWTFSPPPALADRVGYRLDIVRIDPLDGREGDANDAMLSATVPELFTLFTEDLFTNIEIPDALMLDAGYHYAVRVSAVLDGDTPDEEILIQSEVCSFLYAPEGVPGNGVLQPVWPQGGDWVPFDYANIITHFEPFRRYTRFSYTTTMREIGGSGLPDYARSLSWPDGPPGTQQMVSFSDIDAYRSQFLSVYYPNVPDVSLQRGRRYNWRTTGNFTMGGNTYHGDSGEEPFGIGMGPSLPNEPVNDAVVPAGEVTLRWTSAAPPDEPLPPFSVVQASGSGTDVLEEGTTFIDGAHVERWVLEVSRDPDFETIAYTTDGRLTDELWTIESAMDAREAFVNDVYKDLQATPTLTEEGTYYWRLHWKTDPYNMSSATYNTSEVARFCVGRCDDAPAEDTTVTEPPAEEGSADCVSVCLADAITNTTAVGGLAVGSTVRVGKFTMTVLTTTGTTTFSGTGKIPVPFLNNVNVMVDFSGLQWNSDGRMLKGRVEARHDWAPPSLAMVTSGTRLIPTMSPGDVETMNGLIGDGARLVSLLNGGSDIGMPIGIDREVGGRQITLGIINMRFDSLRASLDMVAGIDVMEIRTTLAFGVGDMCFTPDGLGDEGRAYLPTDITVTGDLDTEFRFRGGASTDLANLTYVDWDCHGFKCLQVACAVRFSRSTVVPEGDHAATGTEKVEARFKFNVCREAHGSGTGATESWNVMAQFTMDPFEVPGAPGWAFTVEDAWLDWSTIANPDGIDFPDGYDHPAITGDDTADLWKGFYLKQLSMRTPEVIGDGTGSPLRAGVYNFLVDDQAELSFTVAIENLVAVNQGRIDNWAFSVDSVYMSMLQNTFQRAGLEGRIGLPINGEHDYLRYGAMLGYDDDEDEFAFTLEVELEDTLTAPLWIADMELMPESYVRATLGNESKVRADLTGSISISTGIARELGIDIGSLPSISMPGMRFENLVLDSDEGMSCGDCDFAYASPQKEVGGFPLSIRNLSLEFDGGSPALVVEPMVSLSGGEGESSFAASVALKFTTQMTLGGGGVERFDFKDVLFTGMHLDVDVSAMRLVGDLRITKTATKEEVKGALTVGFPMGIRGDLQAIFGTIRNNPAVPINTSNQHYSYWMVDGMLYFNPGLMIMTGVGIYGFGGGAYHHMRFIDGTLPSNERLQSMAPSAPPDSIPAADTHAGDEHPDDFTSGLTADASTVGSGPAPSGGRYEEDYNTFLGIRLGLVFGTYPKPDGCNMDLTLRAEFTQAGGLQSLTVRGDIYGLVDIPERRNARITGQIGFSYANREGNEVIHANLAVMLDFVVARGAGAGNKLVDANFHTESTTGKWYFIMGTPGNPGGIVVGPPGGAAILRITNYIMTGNDSIPLELPDPPARIMEILGLNDPSRGLGTEAATAAAIGGARDMGPLENGAGFAFGAGFELDLDISLAILYAKFGICLGFDLLLSEVPETLVCVETGARPGDNGWYAQGQFYAGLWGELGVQLDLIFKRFRAPILNMSAAMLLQGNFPNPSGFRGQAAVNYSVLGGAISGSARFEVEDGQQCTLMAAGDPLASFDFIQDLGPKGTDVSIFDLPTASYNLPMQEVLEIPKVIRPDGSVEMYRFRPYVSEFTLREVPGANIPGTNVYVDARGTASHLDRTEVLKANTWHQARVTVRVREEYAPYAWRDFENPETRTTWSESRSQSFRTGAAPDRIPESNVDYTYPVNRQRHFMQQESNNRGRVMLDMGMGYLFQPNINGIQYTYLAKFIPLGGGEARVTPIVYSSGREIPITIPTLDPERIYIVQLLRRRQFTPGAGGTGLDIGGLPGGAVSPALNSAITTAQISAPLTQVLTAANGDVTRLKLLGGNVQQASKLAGGDFLLYAFKFRTSRFNTLQEKFTALTLDAWTPSRYDEFRHADVRGNATEHFDAFDIDGVWKGGVRKLLPLVTFSNDWNDSYYRYLDALMYSPYTQYRNRRTYSFPGNTVNLPAYPVAHRLLWYNRDVDVVSYNGRVDDPISDDEAESAAAPPNITTMITNGPGLGSINTGPSLGGLTMSTGMPAGLGIGSVITNSTLSWPSFGFLYRAGRFASEDQLQMRLATINARSTPGSNGSNLRLLLIQHGPLVNRVNMDQIINQTYTAPYLLHTGNLPVPTGEFPVYYNANYNIVMQYRTPMPASRNTRSTKPFTLRYEAPPSSFGGTVLY